MIVKHNPKGGRKRSSAAQRTRKPQNIVSKLLIGLVVVGLVAGVGYGALLLSSIHSLTAQLSAPPSPQNQPIPIPIPINEPPPQSITPPPLPQTPEPKALAETDPSEPEIIEEAASENEPEVMEEEAMVDEVMDEDEMLNTQEVMAQEILDLKQALPDNRLIPVERTQAEAQELLEEMEEMQSIQELIAQDTATYSDRERYYDIQAKNFEDEIELINLCSERLTGSNDAEENPYGICSNIARDGTRRLQEIEKTMEQLRQELLM